VNASVALGADPGGIHIFALNLLYTFGAMSTREKHLK
jgi:hypothetical protein